MPSSSLTSYALFYPLLPLQTRTTHAIIAVVSSHKHQQIPSPPRFLSCACLCNVTCTGMFWRPNVDTLFYPYSCPLLPLQTFTTQQSLPSFLCTSTNKCLILISSAALFYATFLAQACSGVQTLIPSSTLTHALFCPYKRLPPMQSLPSFICTSTNKCLILISSHLPFSMRRFLHRHVLASKR